MAEQGSVETVKSRLLYNILKEFQNHMEAGDFKEVDKNDIFKALVIKNRGF